VYDPSKQAVITQRDAIFVEKISSSTQLFSLLYYSPSFPINFRFKEGIKDRLSYSCWDFRWCSWEHVHGEHPKETSSTREAHHPKWTTIPLMPLGQMQVIWMTPRGLKARNNTGILHSWLGWWMHVILKYTRMLMARPNSSLLWLKSTTPWWRTILGSWFLVQKERI